MSTLVSLSPIAETVAPGAPFQHCAVVDWGISDMDKVLFLPILMQFFTFIFSPLVCCNFSPGFHNSHKFSLSPSFIYGFCWGWGLGPGTSYSSVLLTSLRLAIPKYVGWAGRLETQEELMLQFMPEVWQARKIQCVVKSKDCWQNFFFAWGRSVFALIWWGPTTLWRATGFTQGPQI